MRYNYMPNVPAVGAVALVWCWWLHADVRVLADVLCWRVVTR